MDALTHAYHLKDFISRETRGKVQLPLMELVSDMDLSSDDELRILNP